MADVWRIGCAWCKVALTVILVGLWTVVSASVPLQTQNLEVYRVVDFGGGDFLPGSTFSDKSAACSAARGKAAAQFPSSSITATPLPVCQLYFGSSPWFQLGYVAVPTTQSACPQNSTPITAVPGTCSCDSTYVQNVGNTGCQSDQSNIERCGKMQFSSNGNFISSSGASGGSKCTGSGAGSGCEMKLLSPLGISVNGVKQYNFASYFSGKTCAQAAADTAAAGTDPVPLPADTGNGLEKNGCPKGEFPAPVLAGFSGSICIPLQSASETETQKTSEVTGADPANPAGPQKTDVVTESTVCRLGKCTTTTTVTDKSTGLPSTNGPSSVGGSNGSGPAKPGTTEQGKDDFCKANPALSICKSGSFSGSCAGAFTCDGDAVQCAIAKEQHVRNCKLFDDRSSIESGIYDTAIQVSGVQNNPDSRASVAITSGSFNSSNAFGAGSGCIGNKDVTIAGFVVSLPFSKVCPFLEYLGYINMLIAALLSVRILTRG